LTLLHGVPMKVSKLHSQLFLLLAVLIIYFPAISGVINTVDDFHIIDAYGINGQRTLLQILLPGNQFYFRPLIELTFYFDNILWGLNPSMMHLESIVLHALNVLIVYQIATRVSSLSGGLPSLPFISASLFAIHPINSEAVSWIAGRTDPLAAFFILLSTHFLLKHIQSGHSKDYYFAFTAMLFSFLAKETSVMLIPASVLMIYSVKAENSAVFAKSRRLRSAMVSHYCFLLVALLGYVAVRLFLKPVGTDNAFSIVFKKNYDVVNLLKDFLITIGFYTKKLFIPFPLNFAISTIDEKYIVVGIVVVILFIYLSRKVNIITSFLLVGFIFLFPAVIVTLTGVNWTPVAERYLYIPAAFFSIGVSGILVHIATRIKHDRFFYSATAIIAIIIAYFTFSRNLVWQDNLTLFQDATIKSPNFGDVHNELGIALAKNGNYKDAIIHFALAEKLSKRTVIQDLARLNLLNCELQGKTNIEKKEFIEHYVASHKNVHTDILKMLRNLTLLILQTETENSKKTVMINKVIEMNDQIYRVAKDPLYLYNNGQLYLKLGDKSAALTYFRKTTAAAPSDAYYFDAAKKLVKNLEKQ
jgi:protein O-mannosyl-transferase